MVRTPLTGRVELPPLGPMPKNGQGLRDAGPADTHVPGNVRPGVPILEEWDDPLGQIGFVSWGTYQTGTILNQSWAARLEVAATANPS